MNVLVFFVEIFVLFSVWQFQIWHQTWDCSGISSLRCLNISVFSLYVCSRSMQLYTLFLFEVNTGQLRCMSFEVNTGQLRCISFEVNTGQLRCMSFEVLIDVTFTYFNLIERGTVYITALIWNTHIKKIRKCSNISVKKYQNTPMFGVRSGTVRLKIKNISVFSLYVSYRSMQLYTLFIFQLD
jgi:hypothetical protein